jgi:hypothetical protein
MEGIAARPEVGELLEEIDQIRLRIAYKLNMPVFGLYGNDREEEWQAMMARLRLAESRTEKRDIQTLRKMRHECLSTIHNAIVSAQHWLDYSYGVARIPGESLANAVSRTPTYQKRSVPQRRYLDEDIPTGLVPLEALAKRFDIDCTAISRILDLYGEKEGKEPRASGRNLQPFTTEYLIRYLKGCPDEEMPDVSMPDTNSTIRSYL